MQSNKKESESILGLYCHSKTQKTKFAVELKYLQFPYLQFFMIVFTKLNVACNWKAITHRHAYPAMAFCTNTLNSVCEGTLLIFVGGVTQN